jgi:hypothetical protein
MVGILPTLFWAIVVGLPALGVWAPSKVFPAEPWLIDKDDHKRYLVYLRNTLAFILFGLAFVQMWISVYKQNTGEEIAGWMTAWLALSFPVLLCLILIAHVLVTRPLRYVIPVLLFAVGIGANIWYGAKTGQIVREKPAQFQIDLRDGLAPIYVTLALPPLRQGIVFLKSGICEPAKNRAGHFIPWAAIREMQPISDEVRDCHGAHGGDGAPGLGYSEGAYPNEEAQARAARRGLWTG